MKRLFCLAALLAFLIPATFVSADITVRPFLIDTTLVPREATTDVIRLESSYDVRTALVYATVNEITVGQSGEIMDFVPPVMTDRTNSVTSWIEITRGRIEIEAGETVDVPIKIHVHPQAQPGEYHVFIGMVEATKRVQAEQQAMAGKADGVIVKVTVSDERVDSMRIVSTVVDRFITDTNEQQITVTIENSGDIASAPQGELIYYNARGVEIGSMPFNTEGAVIQPEAERSFVVTVPADVSVGRYKANVNLRYGSSQTANLFDSTTFFYIPWWLMAVFGGLLLVLILVFMLLYRRANEAELASHHGDDVMMFVRDGHNNEALEHDIDLSTKE